MINSHPHLPVLFCFVSYCGFSTQGTFTLSSAGVVRPAAPISVHVLHAPPASDELPNSDDASGNRTAATAPGTPGGTPATRVGTIDPANYSYFSDFGYYFYYGDDEEDEEEEAERKMKGLEDKRRAGEDLILFFFFLCFKLG
jgi:hypothetical protein